MSRKIQTILFNYTFQQVLAGFSQIYLQTLTVNNGTLGSTGTSATSTITSVGNGWYRCSTATATATQLLLVFTY
jgi:hypothetical protein